MMRFEKQGQKLAILQALVCAGFFYFTSSPYFIVLFCFSFLFFGMAFLAKKKEQQELLDRESIFESLLEGIVVVDDQMTIQQMNGSASRVLGFAKRHLKGKVFPQKEESLLFQKSRGLLETCHRLQCPATDSILIEKGKKTHLDLIAMPRVFSLGSVLIFQDKSSDHKMLEMGKDFVASSSHELRTPITIIRGFAETLQDTKDLPKEIEEEILEKIVRNCQRMETLIRNLLTLADVENIPLPNYQSCDFGALIEECKRLVLAVHPTARIHIKKEIDCIDMEVDPTLLELAIVNLLTNAVKYSTPPAHITIAFTKNSDEVILTIEDRGIGIPPEDVEHIFERFYTVNKAHSRKLGGAGLGLSLVKTIVEKHDGTIHVHSALGVGSTFTLTFPLFQGTFISR